MKILLLPIMPLLFTACAGALTDVPSGASVLRCTEYSGNTATPLTGTSIRADGCQCIEMGDGLAGTVRVELESCEITITP